MNTNLLQTKRRWSWKVFLVLVGLNSLAAFAYQLYYTLQPNANASPGWETYWMTVLGQIAWYAFLIIIGLLLANRIGLGLPFVEDWIKREPVSGNFRTIVAIAWIMGVVCALSLLFLKAVVFDPPMQAMFQELGIPFPKTNDMSPLNGFLAAFAAGIREETFTRLLVLTLIAWLGSLLFHHADGRPKLAVLWAANILTALYFGIGHLQTAAGIGWPMNPLIITYCLVFNGIAGLAFGWLYWKYGLESAMLMHFFADIIVYSVNPLIAMWQGEAARTAVVAGVASVILLTLIWSGMSLMSANRKSTQGRALKAV